MSNCISDNIWKIMIAVVLLAAVAIGIVGYLYFNNFTGSISSEHERWGTFGDFFGGVLNPTLSFLALISLLITIILQSSELKETRKELKLSREAQQKSEASLKEQSITLEKQLEQAKRSSNAEYFFRAIVLMQDEQARIARRVVFDLVIDQKLKFQDWSDKDIGTAEKVCQTYDLVGMMIKNGFIEEKMILSSWHTSVIKSWNCTRDLVMNRRTIEGEEFWSDFEWLYEASKKYS